MKEHLVKFADGAHWYQCRNGEATPEHEADLRRARKEFLYASPTSIDKDVRKNHGLERYKTNELLCAAADNPRQPHESREDYAKRIFDLSLEHAKGAAEKGKMVHAVIDAHPKPCAPESIGWWNQYDLWSKENVLEVLESESILLDHDIGVAGRTDRVINHRTLGITVIDYKTQEPSFLASGKKKFMVYDTWARQLAFYGAAYAKKIGLFPTMPRCLSLVMDSKECNSPNDMLVREWTQMEIADAYYDFVCDAHRFYRSRDYWPQQNGRFELTPSVRLAE